MSVTVALPKAARFGAASNCSNGPATRPSLKVLRNCFPEHRTRGGLAVFENGDLRSFKIADGIGSNSIRSFYEDADGVLWIGSYDGGLTRLKDGKFTVYTMRDGLWSNGVFYILEDAFGWFWMNSNQGIYRVSRAELNDFADGEIRSLNSIAYNKQDGLSSRTRRVVDAFSLIPTATPTWWRSISVVST